MQTAKCVPQMEDVAVTAVRTVPYAAVQIGIENKRESRTHNALLGQFRKNNVKPKMRLGEFKVTDDAMLQPGSSALCMLFDTRSVLRP